MTSARRTFEVVAERYLKAKAESVKPKSHAEIRRYPIVGWKALHTKAIDKINRAEIAEELDSIKSRSGPEAANQGRAALSAMFAWAIHKGLAEANPVIGTERPAESVKRDRVLLDEELARIWRAAPNSNYGSIIKLLVLTGSRRQEIGGLRWSEVDFERCRIVLPGERTKNGLAHIIPLSAPACEILRAHPKFYGRDNIFGEGSRGFSGWAIAKAALDAKLKGVAPWVAHDIRRTVATGMAELAVRRTSSSGAKPCERAQGRRRRHLQQG